MRIFVFLFCIIITRFSFADYFEWYIYHNNAGTKFSITVSSSPAEICQSIVKEKPDKGWVYLRHTVNGNRASCYGTMHYDMPHLPPHSPSSPIADVRRRGSGCPLNHEYNSSTGECEPEPEQCEAGERVAIRKFIPDGIVPVYPGTANLAGCMANYTGLENCAWPYSQTQSDGSVVLGMMCYVAYELTGEERQEGGEEPPEPAPEETPDDTSAEPSGPTPGEDNSCPPGYMLHGETCFRIPPGHEDYDIDHDPYLNSGNNGGNNNGGTGTDDAATDSSLKRIDARLQGIDSSIKGGNATTHDLLRGIKDAISSIPGGGSGSGNQPGTGEGEGEGAGGEPVEGCDGEQCGFAERDFFDGEEVPSFSESFTTIIDGISNSPIGSSISSIRFPTGGTCPTGSLSIDVMGQSMPLVFSSHCDLWEEIAPIISAAFLALWALLAVRVFLSS